MSATNERNSAGIGFFGLLALLFIGLKLAGKIDWGWWVVLSPLWGPPVVLIGIAAMIFVAGLVFGLFEEWRNDRRRS